MIPVVSLLTDFGWRDEYVAAMKARMLNLLPGLRFIDISHDVPPQDIRAGAWLLGRAVDSFDRGTVHLAVVDPGVGTDRQSIAVSARGYFFVAPDNGILDRVLDDVDEAVRLDPEKIWPRGHPTISSTFHGRDLFAPAAARLAEGERLRDLGDPVSEFVRLSWLHERVGDEIRSEVVWVDHFGNLITPIRALELDALRAPLTVLVGDREITGLSGTYGEVENGEALAYIGSGGTLELARRNGSLERQVGAGRGERVTVRGAQP
jgi:S-adenosyl-L-methionine hydrolase (adenosine-forming)